MGHNLLLPLQLGGRHNGKNNFMFFRIEERATAIFSKEFRLQAIAIPLCKRQGIVNSTPHRRIQHVPHKQCFSFARGSRC